MPITHQKIETARQFLDEVVIPDYDDAKADPTSLRKAFHCAQSLFHVHDWVFTEHKTQFLRLKKVEDYNADLANQYPEFRLIRDVANAAKHMELIKGKPSITHAANTAVQSTGYGEGAYGAGPFGGGPRVRVHIGPTNYEEFQQVAEKVLLMWQKLFADNGW